MVPTAVGGWRLPTSYRLARNKQSTPIRSDQAMYPDKKKTKLLQDWLRFIQLDEWSESFLDNGYDDLETVKQIERRDLVAIGVPPRQQVSSKQFFL